MLCCLTVWFWCFCQDGYVPYHSARIELCQAASLDQSKKAHIFMEMLNNCLDQIRAPSHERRVFMRCDVNFDTSSQAKNLNTYIGRAAHIEFLESDIFAKFIMWSFPEYFLWQILLLPTISMQLTSIQLCKCQLSSWNGTYRSMSKIIWSDSFSSLNCNCLGLSNRCICLYNYGHDVTLFSRCL